MLPIEFLSLSRESLASGPGPSHCHSGFGQKFCFESTSLHIPLSGYSVASWMLAVAFVGLLWIFVYLILRRRASRPEAEARWTSAKYANWLWLASIVLIVWIFTLHFSDSWIKIVIRLTGGVLAPPFILVLEGLELALIELQDKEFHNTEAKEMLRQYLEVRTAYLRTREWCLAALIVFLTVIVEFDVYHLPLIGTVEGSLFRFLMSFVLASMILIWTSQTPGKEFGMGTPVDFLCGGRFPELVQGAHWLVLKLIRVADDSQIDRPTKLAYRGLRRILKLPHPRAELPPGGPRFFSELIRRYCYGDCDVTETFLIRKDGSASLTQNEFVYIGKGYPLYTRVLVSDEPFNDWPDVICKAYVVKKLDVLMEDEIEAWKDGQAFIEEIEHINDPGQKDISWQTEDHKKIAITINLKRAMFLEDDQGILLIVETKAEYAAGAWKAANFLGKDGRGEDQFVRTLAKPCFKAVTQFKLDPDSDHHFDGVEVVVTQAQGGTQVDHLPETAKFRRLLERRDKQHHTLDGLSRDRKTLTLEIRYGLPGAKYKASWQVKK